MKGLLVQRTQTVLLVAAAPPNGVDDGCWAGGAGGDPSLQRPLALRVSVQQ